MQAKYQIDTIENREFLRNNAENILSFGHRFPSPGGGSYYLGDDGTPWKDRPRETWITIPWPSRKRRAGGRSP